MSLVNIPDKNLVYIDSRFDTIRIELKKAYLERDSITFHEAVVHLQKTNPLIVPYLDVYQAILRRLLAAFLFGELHSTSWNGNLDYTKMKNLYCENKYNLFNPWDIQELGEWAINRVSISV